MLGLRRFKATDWVLFIICLMYLITYIDRVNISTAAPEIQRELGLSNTQLGLAFSAFAYPYAFFQIAGGWLGDRLGPRWTLVLCGTLWSVATVAIGFAGGAASLIVIRFLLGLGEGAAFPVATRALSNWMTPDKRGFAQGITHSFSRFGNAATPPIVALLITTVSWRGSFIIVGLISLLWVGVWWLYFRDDPREHARVTPAELVGLPDYVSRANRKPVPWWRLFKRVLPVTLTDFCYGWTLWLFLSWIPSFFLHQYHMNIGKTAIFASAVFFAGVVGDTVGGVASDWILKSTGNVARARVSVIVFGFLGAFVFMAPLAFTSNLTIVMIGLSGAFFCAELIVGPIWAVPMDIAPQHAGTAAGFMNFGFGLAGMISPIVFGWVIDTTGRWDLPFVLSLGLLLLGAVLAFFMKPEIPFLDAVQPEGRPVAPGMSARTTA